MQTIEYAIQKCSDDGDLQSYSKLEDLLKANQLFEDSCISDLLSRFPAPSEQEDDDVIEDSDGHDVEGETLRT